MSGSTIKQVIPALVIVFAGAGVPGLQVVDGPIWEPKNNSLAVAWSAANQPPVQASRNIADAGMRADQESYDITCLLSYRYGNSDVPKVRAAVLDAFDLLDAALDADPKLGAIPGVARARISEYTLEPDIYETGEHVGMTFNVHVEAWK